MGQKDINWTALLVGSIPEAILLLLVMIYATPMLLPYLGGIATPVGAELALGNGITLYIAIVLKNIAYAMGFVEGVMKALGIKI